MKSADKDKRKKGAALLSYSKISCPILLMCPVATQVYRMEGTKRITVGNGDDIGECTFYTKSGFIRRLENDSFDFEYRV